MTMETLAVTVKILDKEYRIACPPQEREALVQSAQFLNRKMREIKDRGVIVGSERVAVMAALNIAHELLQQKSNRDARMESIKTRVKGLQERIENALKNPQLEV